MMDQKREQRASIIVRNYNGQRLLARFLPSVMDAVRTRGDMDEVIVVDDGSTDGSADFVARGFPSIRLLRLSPNSGNSIDPVNAAVEYATHDIVICLDNDVEVDSGFITPLLKHFRHEDVFAVCSRIYNPNEDMAIESVNYPLFRRGRLVGVVPGKKSPSSLGEFSREVWYAPLNGAAYDRRKYLSLGGLDRIFRPIYEEEVDMCYRAWKRGWRSIYEPASITWHLQHVTVKSAMQISNTEVICTKNNLLLTWKDLDDPGLLLAHIGWLSLRLFRDLAMRRMVLPRGFLLALRQWREVARGRQERKRMGAVAPDRGLFRRLQLLNGGAGEGNAILTQAGPDMPGCSIPMSHARTEQGHLL